MNLPIQNWLNTQKISKEALSSFDESVICFKVGAYKASLLFAYLGFMNVIRDRIIAAPTPTGFPPKRWAEIQSDAKSPETWEKVVFDKIQQKQPVTVFDVPDDLRGQVKYWKDRRNDCAHSRQNKIIAAHVESLYAFIESNLGKFAVNGSRSEMLKRILDHFNPSLTSPNESITPIIHDLLNALTSVEYPAFITEVVSELENTDSDVPTLLGVRNPSVVKFLGACFKEGNDELRDACSVSLFANEGLLVDFLREHPDKVYILQNQPRKVRLIWHDYLFDKFHSDFSLLGSLLRASLIPQDQIEEAILLAIKASASQLPSEVDLQILIQHGYYVLLEKMIVDEELMDRYNWANSNKELIVKYLSDNPISLGVAHAIYKAFIGPHYAWHLAEYLNRFFVQNPNKKAEYLAHRGEELHVGIPSKLPSLLDE